jgi:hypothetical protein
MALIHQLNTIVAQIVDIDLEVLTNTVAVRELINRTKDYVGHDEAALFVTSMEIKLVDGLHTEHPEAFDELMDMYATMICKVYDIATTLGTGGDRTADIFINMAGSASLTCND